MKAGNLRHVIDIQDASVVADGQGGFVSTWTAVSGLANLRAAIWPLSGTERLESDKLELAVSHKIRIRYHSGITAEMRIKHGIRYFNIKSIINPDERNIMVDMLAEEIDGGS